MLNIKDILRITLKSFANVVIVVFVEQILFHNIDVWLMILVAIWSFVGFLKEKVGK